MLSSGGTALLDSTITATLGGLTAGQQYRIQWWTSDPANSQGVLNETFATTTATSGTSSVTLDSNSTNANGGLGQYVIGTFTADATSQTFDLNSPSGNTSPLIDGFQLRTVAVPEPSTWVLAATAALGFAVAARRRSARCSR
ncbi:MAG: PEP-CTERM sorting domain-containing protein [Planctomycetaceae bacterium]